MRIICESYQGVKFNFKNFTLPRTKDNFEVNSIFPFLNVRIAQALSVK